MTVSLAYEVERAVSSGDSESRRIMLRRMTDLFVDNAGHLTQEQVSAFDTVIVKLAASVESAARAALAESVADIANAPPKVVSRLALDPAISVAGPVIARSAQLAETDLVTIARERGQAHLVAMTRRRSLSERVTDVLVARGDDEVMRAVAGNGGARFSEEGFGRLATRAEADSGLRDALRLRHDVPPAHMARLLAAAQAEAARKLRSEFGPEAVSAAVSDAARAIAGEASSIQAAAAEVDAYLTREALAQPDEKVIVAWLGESRVMEALAGTARAAGMPPDLVLRAYQNTHHDPLLFLVRSARFGWGTLKAFLVSKAVTEPDPAEMRGVFQAFQALSVTTAQRVVRFTAARDQMLKAG